MVRVGGASRETGEGRAEEKEKEREGEGFSRKREEGGKVKMGCKI